MSFLIHWDFLQLLHLFFTLGRGKMLSQCSLLHWRQHKDWETELLQHFQDLCGRWIIYCALCFWLSATQPVFREEQHQFCLTCGISGAKESKVWQQMLESTVGLWSGSKTWVVAPELSKKNSFSGRCLGKIWVLKSVKFGGKRQCSFCQWFCKSLCKSVRTFYKDLVKTSDWPL